MDFGKRGYFSRCMWWKKYGINPAWMLRKGVIFHKVCHAKDLRCSFISIIFSMFFTKWDIVSGPKSPRFHGKRGVKMSKTSMERGDAMSTCHRAWVPSFKWSDGAGPWLRWLWEKHNLKQYPSKLLSLSFGTSLLEMAETMQGYIVRALLAQCGILVIFSGILGYFLSETGILGYPWGIRDTGILWEINAGNWDIETGMLGYW